MSSKFAPDVPKSLIDAVSSIMNEAKADELPPIDKTEAQKRKERQAKLDAIEDKRAERDAGKEKPKSAVTKVTGHQYGGGKQKEPAEVEEELKGNQHKIDANKNGKIDADDFKKLRGEELKGNQHKIDANKNGKIDADDFKKLRAKKEEVEIEERTMTSAETKEKEHIVKSMKKGLAGFKARYGSKAKNVMYATATKQAMKKEETVTEGIVNHADIAKDLVKKHGKNVTMDHIDDYIDGADDAHKVDKREVLHHIKLLQDMNCESVQITEGKMKDIFTTMQMHATKKGYKNHKQFTPDDYHQMGKEHGISGQDLSVIAGHKTAAQAEIDLPFTPDKNPKKLATAGKHGYGPSAAAHLAHQGMAGLTKEGTGGPIYSKPIVKLGDLLARAKDMKNIKQATIVTPKDENQVVMKKEETEQVDETMMGKAGCTSEDDKKKAKPVDYDKPTFLRKKDDWRKSDPKFQPKKLPMSKAAGVLAAEEFVSEAHFMEIPSDVKKEIKKHIDNDDHDAARSAAVKAGYWSHFNHLVSAAAHSSHMDHDTHHTDIKQLHPYMSDYLKEESELNESLITGTKKISTHEAGKHKAEVIHNSEYNEFQVHYYKDGKHRGEGPVSYHENDRADATASAKREIERLGKTQEEEVESIQEIGDTPAGKKALKSYIHKSLDTSRTDNSIANLGVRSGIGLSTDAPGAGEKDDKKAVYRSKWVRRAVDRLTKNESVEQLDELDPKTLASYANKAVGDTSKDRSKMIKVADKKLYGNPDLRYKSEGFNTFKGVAAEIKAGTFSRSKPDLELAKQKKKDLESSFENKTKKRTEEVSIDETATLDKYIRSMGYDPQHLDKNKKVMFAKTNAYKTFASSQKTEGLYDGGQKGTQDIDTHMSPGATARG